MLAIDRLKIIEDMLSKNGSVVISNLSTMLEVSEETIRRDLEKIGKTMRRHSRKEILRSTDITAKIGRLLITSGK